MGQPHRRTAPLQRPDKALAAPTQAGAGRGPKAADRSAPAFGARLRRPPGSPGCMTAVRQAPASPQPPPQARPPSRSPPAPLCCR